MDRMAVLLRMIEQPTGYWLDIGTGDGVFTKILRRDHSTIIPVQMDKQKFIPQSDLCFLGRLEQLPIRSASIDGMICAQVLHFVPKNQQYGVLQQLANYLIPDGELILIAYVHGKSYPWVPYHFSETDIRSFAEKSPILSLVDIFYDDDTRRPKFAVHLKKI
jgi:phospholipid N-methyltransferase